MTAPAITIGPDAKLGEAARLMHRRAVKRLPVVDPADGTILGIVSRTDLLKVFLRDDAEIARELHEDVIRRTLWIDPDTIRIVVRDGVVTMEGQIGRNTSGLRRFGVTGADATVAEMFAELGDDLANHGSRSSSPSCGHRCARC